MTIDDPEHQVHRKLDQLVGRRFDEDAGRRWRKPVKWVVAAACAVGTAGLVVYGIESHRLPTAAQMHEALTRPPPPPQKPVTVQILPAKPP